MDTVLVKFTAPWGRYLPGDSLFVDAPLLAELLAAGVIEADQLPDYTMELTETADRSPAVLFKRRGEAEALALAERMRAEEERRARFDADRRRTEEVDARMDQLAGRS